MWLDQCQYHKLFVKILHENILMMIRALKEVNGSNTVASGILEDLKAVAELMNYLFLEIKKEELEKKK